MVPLLLLLALSLVAADAPRGVTIPSTPYANDVRVERPQISYEVRILNAPSAAWRAGFYRHCKRVGLDGISAIWTLDEAGRTNSWSPSWPTPPRRSARPPKVTAYANVAAQISNTTPIYYVARAGHRPPGRPGQAVRRRIQARHREIRDGWSIRIDGEKVGPIVKANVDIDSVILKGFSSVPIPESVEGPSGKTIISGQIQMPELVKTKVSGSYEIPQGQVLLISLGTEKVGKGGLFDKVVLANGSP
jgi:hypothetical protein